MNADKERLFFPRHKLIAWLSVCLALFFWLLDAYVDSYLLVDSSSYLNAVFPIEEPVVLWMRALVCFLIYSLCEDSGLNQFSLKFLKKITPRTLFVLGAVLSLN